MPKQYPVRFVIKVLEQKGFFFVSQTKEKDFNKKI